jgi:hypothetical protein
VVFANRVQPFFFHEPVLLAARLWSEHESGGCLMIDRFYSIGEAGEMLGVDPSTVLAWVHSGEMVASNCSKNPNSQKVHWRIAAQEICRFLQKRQNASSDPVELEKKRPKRRPTKKPKQYV